MKNLLFLGTSALLALSAQAGVHTSHVDPMIGTGAVAGGLSGNNYPGATVPFGMVQLSPDTHPEPDWYNASGYSYTDTTLYSFSHTRLSGTGASDLIDLGFFPTTGRAERGSFSHATEKAAPGYYAVTVAPENVRAELTATPHAGVHRYTFPANSKEHNVWVDFDHSIRKGSWGCTILNSQLRIVGDSAIEGYRIITGWAKVRKVCFYAMFSRPIKGYELLSGDRVYEAPTSVVNGNKLKALLKFGDGAEDVVCRVGLSPVSVANARENLMAECSHNDFARYVADADAAWERALGCIDVEGDAEQMKTFYTALYHTMIQPNLFSDVNGQFVNGRYETEQLPAGEKQYTTFSLWDTYRGAHPLYTIVNPELAANAVNSMIRHYETYGYLPIWELWGQDNYCMIGNHAIPVIVDAVCKGIPGIDAERAYAAVKGSSVNAHPNSPFDIYEKLGYMPEDKQSQSVSITMEMSYDDWCVARLAEKLGRTADAAYFYKRSQNYRNLFDRETGFFRGRNANGEWLAPFDALKHGGNGGAPYTEGNAWQYYWYVPHEVDNLIALTGGRDAFVAKLDTFFTLTEKSGEQNNNVSGSIGQYAHGNEPSHHVAYLYAHAGRPEKTTAMLSRIMREMYNNTSSGYAGNDDCGEMSAWYVLTALGFYPVNPASGDYVLGLPLFPKATIHLPNGKEFTVVAERSKPDATKVAKVTLNGKAHTSPLLTHKDLMAGGTLHFKIK